MNFNQIKVLIYFIVNTFIHILNAGEPDLILFEDFDNPKSSGLYAELVKHEKLHIAEGEGVSGSTAIKASYVGFEQGNERIVVNHNLPERGLEYSFNIQFRGVAGDSTLISKLLFSTFHGGNTENYAPKDEEGNFTTVYAYFDNFAVYRGEYIRKYEK
jgi:hypothetical protein